MIRLSCSGSGGGIYDKLASGMVRYNFARASGIRHCFLKAERFTLLYTVCGEQGVGGAEITLQYGDSNKRRAFQAWRCTLMAFSPDGHCRDVGTLQAVHMREVAGHLTLPFGFRASHAPLGNRWISARRARTFAEMMAHKLAKTDSWREQPLSLSIRRGGLKCRPGHVSASVQAVTTMGMEIGDFVITEGLSVGVQS